MHKLLPGLLVACLISFAAFAQDLDASMWVPDLSPTVVTRDGNTIYLAGHFNSVGPPTGSAVTLDARDGTLPAIPATKLLGSVNTSVPDGKGGWYVGGHFKREGNPDPIALVHLLANGEIDPDWNVQVSGGDAFVSTLALAGNRLYLGGNFTVLGGQPRSHLAAVDAATGRPTDWNPAPDSTVLTLALSGNMVYFGGPFTKVGGTKQAGLAAVDASSGALQAWNPAPNSLVRTLVAAGSTLYAWGYFSWIGGQSRYGLAALDAVTGQATGWNPSPNGWVTALALAGNTIYIGGHFSNTGGQTRQYLAAFDAATGQLTPWQPRVNAPVTALAVSGSAVVLGGNFTLVNDQRSQHLAAVDAATGQTLVWKQMVDRPVLTASVAGGRIFIGGEFNSAGMVPRKGLAALDATTGQLTPWDPAPHLKGLVGVHAMAAAAGKVFIAAHGDGTDPAHARELYVVDAFTGARSAWEPLVQGTVYTMLVAGKTLYLAGGLTQIDGQPLHGLAAIDLATGQLTSWRPRANAGSMVNTLAIHQGIVFAGGDFTTMNDVPRNSLAALDAASGEVTAWNPELSGSGTVFALGVYGNNVYVSGYFMVGQAWQALRSFDATTARVTSWKPVLSGIVYGMVIAGDAVYVGGRSLSASDPDQSALIAFDPVSGQLAPWKANVGGGEVLSMFGYGSTVYIVGGFTKAQDQPRPHFAAFGGKVSYSYLKGKVFEDTNGDCVQNNGEKGIAGRVVVAQPGNYFSYTDSLGEYRIMVDTGRYTLEQVVPASLKSHTRLVCPANPSGQTIHVRQSGSTVAGYTFALQTVLKPQLSVGISSDRRRRCFTSVTTVSYCNEGMAAAQNVRVHVQLPEHVALVSARQAYTRDPDGSYVFTVGTLAAGSCGTVQLVDSVVCNNPNIRGLTQCTKTWITPANDRVTDPAWDRSYISLKATCGNNGRVRLALYNAGTGDMADSSAYRIYLDAQLAFTRNFKLAQGDSLVLQVPANGRTVRLEADQRPAHPDKRQSNITIEGCGTNSGGTVSKGFVCQLPQDDEEPEVAIECLPIIDSFDPNDKTVSPEGVTDQHYTPTGRALDYVVRFQNTGTDVAYRVVVVDTLSEHLDISTLRVGAVSHPYTVQVSGKGRPVLTFTFKDINLPDSTADEPRSHGRIQFSIQPKASLPEKTRVENLADIFFDYNEPVRTNTTVNTLYDLPPVVVPEVALSPSEVCPVLNEAASAGAHRTICEQDTVKLAAGQPLAGNGRWKLVRGAGTIREPNQPDATVTALAYGENVFEWRIPAGRCSSDSLAASVTITRRQKPVAEISQSGADQLVCSLAGSRYEWFLDGVKLDKGGQRIVVTQSGRYSVRVEMPDGCHADLSQAYAYAVTGLVPGAAAAVRVFPNPTTGRLVVRLPVSPAGPVHVTVVDKIGRTVLSQTLNPAGNAGEWRAELDLSGQATGSYVLKLQTATGLYVRSVFKR